MSSILSRLFSLMQGNKLSVIMISVIVAALLVDTSMSKTATLAQWNDSTVRIDIFLLLCAICLVGQFVVLKFVSSKTVHVRSNRQLRIDAIHKVVTIVQCALALIILYVIVQMSTQSYYNSFILTLAVAISYGSAIVILGLLSQRFFSWFTTKRNIVVLFYGFSSAWLCINSVLTVVFVIWLMSTPQQVGPNIAARSFSFTQATSPLGILNSLYIMSSIVSFGLTWCATALLLRHYTKKIGAVKYWLIAALPLVTFLGGFPSLSLNLFGPLLELNPSLAGMALTLFFTSSKSAGGIFFAIGFAITARTVRRDSALRNYMVISAYGLVLLFVSNQAIVLPSHTYPPFGLISVCFMGLSSYLLLIGIYATSISVAQDSNLRKSVRGLALQEPGLLHSIGFAQMEKKILQTATDIKERMSQETKVEVSYSMDEIKVYVHEVIQELKNSEIN